MKIRLLFFVLVSICLSAYSADITENDSTATGERRRNPKTLVNQGTGTPTGEKTRNPNKQNTTKPSESLSRKAANRNAQ